MVKQAIKTLLHAVAPKRYDALMAERDNRRMQAYMESEGVPAVAAAIIDRHGLTVQGGPFAGMSYVPQSAGSSFVPKLIGSYEQELHGILAGIVARPYETVVDIGSAEGFYAVGLAMRLPSAKVYACDINAEANALCRSLAQKNGVEDRVLMAGRCDPDGLERLLRGMSLVVCDCEGYELEILQPAAVPSLAATDILVELHDWVTPGITAEIKARFAPTHEIEMIDTTERDTADYPAISFLEPGLQQVAVSEFRPAPQQWAYMTPKSARVAIPRGG